MDRTRQAPSCPHSLVPTIGADAPRELVRLLGPIARLLGRVTAKESISAVPSDIAPPQQQPDDSHRGIEAAIAAEAASHLHRFHGTTRAEA